MDARERGAHLDPSLLARLAAAAREGGSGVAAEAERHLRACRSCAGEVALRAALLDVAPPADDLGPCPDGERLVRRADGLADDDDAIALERHLSACIACAAEVEALERAGRPAALAATAASASPVASLLAEVAERLRALVAFDMPRHLALTTRSAATTATSPAVKRALADYRKERWEEARERLLAAEARGDASPELAFYLGVSLLRAGEGAAAAERLARAVRAAPRLGEYRWFLAQAQLAAGEGEAALRSLKRAAALPGPFAARARALAREAAAVLAG